MKNNPLGANLAQARIAALSLKAASRPMVTSKTALQMERFGFGNQTPNRAERRMQKKAKGK